VVFSDSKLALLAATSRKKSLTNTVIAAALKKAYINLVGVLPVELHWIHGHAGIGGNERVDTLSKRFASRPNNDDTRPFTDFAFTTSSSPWRYGYPLTGLPSSFFTRDVPSFAA
jgi:hypothetical protein